MDYLIASLILIFIALYLFGYIPVYIKSEIDNRYYLVSNTKDKQEVANALALLNKNVDTLLFYLDSQVKQYPDLKYATNIKKLLNQFNPDSLSENFLRLGTSFTLNKGNLVAMCVKNNEKIHDTNILMYVLLHELAHVGSYSTGHSKEFIHFFRYLVNIAIKLNLYVYVDYSVSPTVYCGLTLDVSI